jgi:hypothetical protein
MRNVIAAFAAVGMVSGFLLVIGPFLFFRMAAPVAAFVALSVLGLLVLATHWLNWRRLRDPEQDYPRGRLFMFNLALLVFFGANFALDPLPPLPLVQVALWVLYPLPFVVNAIYLCTPNAAASTQ